MWRGKEAFDLVVTKPRVDAGNEPLAVPVRRLWTRLSSAHILIFSAGVLAFVANLAVLRPSELPPNVAVAASDLLPGTVFDGARHVEFVPMETDPELVSRFLTDSSVAEMTGHIVAARVPEGAALTYEALVAQPDGDGRRIMSLPIEPERAAGGSLVVGDVVDVIAVRDGLARYVVTGLEIVALPETRTGSFTGSSGYHVVLAVDAEAGLELSAALDTATIHVIRSTGSSAPSTLELAAVDDQ
jgi:Flp pilus assembly protein CpaB